MAPKTKPVGPPPPPLTVDPSACLCDSISMVGIFPIHIGANTFLHPKCKLISTDGPINIGENCIISERSQLIAPDPTGLLIEDNVLIEMNVVVEASKIAEGSQIEVGSKLGKKCTIGRECIIGPLTTIPEGEALEDHVVTFGHNQRRIDHSETGEMRKRAIESQIECLKVLLPNKSERYITT